MKLFILYFFSVCFVSSSLFATDSRIAQSARERHALMLEYFQQEKPEVPQPNWWDDKYMTGNWNGARKTLANAGITIDGAYVADVLGNPIGGKARGFAYAGSFGVSTNINFTKAGLTGLNLFASICWRTGTNLSSRKIDNQFPVAQVFGSETVRLSELYLMETLFEKRFTLKAGRLNAGNDFLSSPLYWQYVNNAFDGNPIAIFFNIPFTAYPNGTWGALMEVLPFKRLSAKFAIYNANSKIQQNKYHGVNFTFANTNGVVWITEWCALVNQEKGDHGMPGNYKAGFFYLTGNENKFSGGEQKGDPGGYLLFDQMIYRKGGAGSDQGLTPFISLFFQPKNRNLFPFFVDAGLVYKGIFEGRPKDSAAFGVAYGKYSSDLAHRQRRTHQEPQNQETVLELNYWAQLNKWFYITPDIQYIIHPKGTNTPNAFVIGFQIGLDQW